MLTAIDLGFGWTKALGARAVRFPSVVGPGRQLFDAGLAGADPTRHLVHEDEFVGELAIRQSTTREFSLHPDHPGQAATRTLFRTALALAADDGPADLVTGLPVSWYGEQRTALERVVGGHHSIQLRTGTQEIRREVTVERVRVVPQPLGAALDWLLQDDGQIDPIRRQGASGTIGVLDVGLHTADLLLLRGLEVIHPHSRSTRSGLHVALKSLADAGLDQPLYELDQDVLAGRHRAAVDAALQGLARHIRGEVETYWPAIDLILVAGGGGAALYDYLDLPRAVLLQDAGMANVRGYMKLGRRTWGDRRIPAAAKEGPGPDSGGDADRARPGLRGSPGGAAPIPLRWTGARP